MSSAVDQAARDLFGVGVTEEPVVLPDIGDLASKYEEHEHVSDPVGWIESAEFLWSKQKTIAESVGENRYTAVPSAHGPGKSFTAARIVAWWLDVHPIGEAFAVTTAPTWNQVKAILWRELRQAKIKRGLAGRTTLACEWYVGGARIGDEEEQLIAYGRKPADYDQAAFQGIHARYVLIVIDEGSGVPKLLYDAVDSLATNRHARVLAIGNPDDPASQFASICKPGSGWNVIPISVYDTPAFTGEKIPDSLYDLLPSKEWVEERKVRWGVSSPIFKSKVLGEFPDIGEDTLIEPRWIAEAEARDLSGRSRRKATYGYDIARYGSDKTVGYRNKGGVLRQCHRAEKASTMTTAGVIKREVGPSNGGTPAVVDVGGLGAGVVDRLREQHVRGIVAFNGGEAPFDPERFKNRRAELMWQMREAFEEGEIDLAGPGEDDELKAQLGSLKYKIDSKGRISIESKDDMKKRGLPSPDEADAAAMAMMPNATAMPNKDERAAIKARETVTGDLLEREL